MTSTIPTATPTNALDDKTASLDGSVGQWLLWFNTSVAPSAKAHSGTGSLQVNIDVTDKPTWGITVDGHGFDTGPGPHTISFWALDGVGGVDVTMSVQWLDAQGAPLGDITATNAKVDPVTSVWTEGTDTLIAPAGTAKVLVFFKGTKGVAGDSLYLDDIFVGSAIPSVSIPQPQPIIQNPPIIQAVIRTPGWPTQPTVLKALWGWGKDAEGELGDNKSGVNSYVPVAVDLPPDLGILAVSAGYYHNLALLEDGRVWGWGTNEHGQLGNNSPVNSARPVPVVDPTTNGELKGIVAVAAGGDGRHSVALTKEGTVLTWGQDDWGQLGRSGPLVDHVTTPVKVTDLDHVTAVTAGGWHTLALRADGTLWSWGANNYGQLGDGTIHGSIECTRRRVLTLEAKVTAMAAGNWHSLAVLDNGTVWAWGNNDTGQLGNAAAPVPSGTPVQVQFPPKTAAPIAVAGGYNFSLALLSDGTVWAWGYGGFGSMGNGKPDSWHTPTLVSVPAARAIAAGAYHGAAILTDGTVKTWGANDVGALGDGSVGGWINTPVTVVTDKWPTTKDPLTNVKAISAGAYHTIGCQ
jgi:alpha-tubulin suppressor-like RCC1 family protein